MNRVTAEAAKPASPTLLLTMLVMLAAATSAVLPRVAGEDVRTSVTERARQLARAGHTEEAVRLLQATLAVTAGRSGREAGFGRYLRESWQERRSRATIPRSAPP